MSLFSKALPRAGFLCALALIVSFSTSVQAATRTITDALGRKVEVKNNVERVVINFNFEEFTAIAGVENWAKVVGMSRSLWEGWRPAIFSRYQAVIPNLAAMPEVGNTEENSLSVEKIIALKPDVFFVAEWGFKALGPAEAQLKAAGIPIVVIDYNAQILERHLASTRAIGTVMGTSQRAEELAALYEQSFNDIQARIARSKLAPQKVYVELGQAGAATYGNSYSNTMWGKIITTLKAVNIADGKLPGPWGPLNAETVLAENPDLIFIAGSSWINRPLAVKTGYDATPEITRASLLPYAQRPGWSNLKAGQKGQIFAIEHGLSRTLFDFVAYQYIAKQLYPDAFADVDPDANFRAYHARYLPVGYSGTWMIRLTP
jgi:ABC-type Fe3+-hydroxamate transport system substrate-binding protein